MNLPGAETIFARSQFFCLQQFQLIEITIYFKSEPGPPIALMESEGEDL